MSTFGDILQSVTLECMLFRGAKGLADDPTSLAKIIWQAADEVAELTDCFYGTTTLDLVQGKADYCESAAYRIKTMNVLDASGRWWPLSYLEGAQADMRSYGQWRNYPGIDPPTSVIFNGVNAITLFPMPSVSRNDAVQFQGYMKPGPFWKYGAAVSTTTGTGNAAGSNSVTVASAAGFRANDTVTFAVDSTQPETQRILSISGNVLTLYGGLNFAQNGVTCTDDQSLVGLPLAADHVCPLPVWAHQAVEELVKLKAARLDRRKEIRDRIPEFKSTYDQLLGRAEAHAATHHQQAGSHKGFGSSWRFFFF